MNKTALSILLAIMFAFGAAGVTLAAARQSQPGDLLYPVRTWSDQHLRQQRTVQTQTIQSNSMAQLHSPTHELEVLHSSQATMTPEACGQPGSTMQCGLSADTDHANDSHDDHNESHDSHSGTGHDDHGGGDEHH